MLENVLGDCHFYQRRFFRKQVGEDRVLLVQPATMVVAQVEDQDAVITVIYQPLAYPGEFLRGA